MAFFKIKNLLPSTSEERIDTLVDSTAAMVITKNTSLTDDIPKPEVQSSFPGVGFLKKVVDDSSNIVKVGGEKIFDVTNKITEEVLPANFKFDDKGGLPGIGALKNIAEDSMNIVKTGGENILDVTNKIKDMGIPGIGDNVNVLNDGVNKLKDTAGQFGNLIDGGNVQNVTALLAKCKELQNLSSKYKGFLESDSIIQSTVALSIWIFICWIFQLWMIPVGILIVFIGYHIQRHVLGWKCKDDGKLPDVKISLTDQVQAVQALMTSMQSILVKSNEWIGHVCSVIDFSTPRLSWMAVLIQALITCVLLYFPLNYLLILWGISVYMNKFLQEPSPPKTSDGKSSNIDVNHILDVTTAGKDVVEEFVTTTTTDFIKGDLFNKLTSKLD